MIILMKVPACKAPSICRKDIFGACHQIGADAIYATNANRKYCTENKIATSFIAKGNEGKTKEQKSQMRSILGKVRSTVMEGSFGNEKNHYQMNKIKAKTEANEKAWILAYRQAGFLACWPACYANNQAYAS